MSYVHLTPIERGQIQTLLQGKSTSYIARLLGRHVSSITREVWRNGSGGNYDADKAQRLYRQRHNVIVTGPTGTGKSYLACALGHKACRQGYRVRYSRVSLLFQDLAARRGRPGATTRCGP